MSTVPAPAGCSSRVIRAGGTVCAADCVTSGLAPPENKRGSSTESDKNAADSQLWQQLLGCGIHKLAASLRMRRAAAAGGDFSRSTQQPSHRGDPSASGDNAGRPTGSRASRAASAASTVGASVRPPPRQPWSAEPGPASPTAAMAMSNLRHERSLAGMQLQGLGSAARPDHLTPVNEMMAKSSRAKSSPAGVQENGEPKWAEDPMSSLLQLPMVQTGAWQDYVHAVVWRVGRQFGFQPRPALACVGPCHPVPGLRPPGVAADQEHLHQGQ
ncbi:hypothetical protein HaLaN_05282, partial [Haematococcus lacustris]